MTIYKKIAVACIGLFAMAQAANAQQVPLHSQQQYTPFIYNPAYTGFHDLVHLNLVHRAQWTGIEGAPVTSMLTVDGPLISEKVGIGMIFFNDLTGITKRTGGYGNYSYKLDLTDGHTLRMGLAFGAINNSIDFSAANVESQSDPLLFSANQSRMSVDGNFGVLYNWEEQNLEVGISMPHLFGNSLRYQDSDDSRVYYTLARHYLFNARYRYEIDDDWSISPMVMMRAAPGTPFQYDINVMGSYQDFVWLGITYKSNYAIGIDARGAFHDKRLGIGFGYDIVIGDLQGYTGSAAEFALFYKFAMSGGGGGGSNGLRGKYD